MFSNRVGSHAVIKISCGSGLFLFSKDEILCIFVLGLMLLNIVVSDLKMA